MKLSIKQKALLQTIGLLSLTVGVSLLVSFILTYVSTPVILNIMGVALIAWFVYMFYLIALSRLEHQETWKKANELFDKK